MIPAPLPQVDACVRGLSECVGCCSINPKHCNPKQLCAAASTPAAVVVGCCISQAPPHARLRYGITPGSSIALLLVPGAEFTLLQLAGIKLGATNARSTREALSHTSSSPGATVVCIDPCADAAVLASVLRQAAAATCSSCLQSLADAAAASTTYRPSSCLSMRPPAAAARSTL